MKRQPERKISCPIVKSHNTSSSALSIVHLTNIIPVLTLFMQLSRHIPQFMKKIRLGNGFTVFLLFFGISVIEAFSSRDWPNVAFWLVIGIVFLVADNLKQA